MEGSLWMGKRVMREIKILFSSINHIIMEYQQRNNAIQIHDQAFMNGSNAY